MIVTEVIDSPIDVHPMVGAAPDRAPISRAGLLGRCAATLFLVWFTGMCAYALVLWQSDQAEFDSLAVLAPGLVVDVHHRMLSGGGGRFTSDPQVVFETARGERIEFIDTSAIDLGVGIGDRVDVLYVPDQPQWARIDSGAQDTNSTAIAIMLGVLTGVSAIGAFFAGRSLTRAVSRSRFG